ncbi:MarR family winged helix-turn-helix transcriptional regulator [Hydrogenophaga palleronii]|uniref:MarR family winged helix-turn-helix transcriptional regulator n=1 Tax=Hydrogenophaga palleronii TaxID=65655 RepID=UPI000825B95B|nr:MarR family transcriptional regulator [Hydrogenophaga palleronii]
MPDPNAPARFYEGGHYTPEESVGFLLKRVLMSFVCQADKRLCDHDLTSAQWNPMMNLRMRGTATVAELARWSMIDAGAMTRLLDRLEKKGLCKRMRSTEDRRVVMVELTTEGRATMEHVPEVLADVMNRHLAGFSEAEWQQLLALLTRMVANGDAQREAG